MVNSLNELSDLSRKLNQKSDKTNSIITTINKKLAVLNFGLEVWLKHPTIKSGDFESVYSGQIDRLPRQRSVVYLGYCNVEDGWQLAAKSGLLVEDWDKEAEETYTELTEVEYQPLLRAPREVRVGALPLVPRLLDEIKLKAESLLKAIDEAEKAANALTDATEARTPDYRIERDGKTVVLVSERATQRGSGPKPQQGARLAFKNAHDTLQFVRAAEAEGFLFEGKDIFGERGKMPTV
jgi:hypothetical protein